MVPLIVAAMLSCASHASHPLPTTLAPAALPLPIDVVTTSTLPASSTIVSDALEEAASIWSTVGITVQWRRVDPTITRDSPNLMVIVDDEIGASRDDGVSLGWITFDASGLPERTIHLSRLNGARLLDTVNKYSSLPMRAQETLVGRALGRALAHEIGHYLLQTPAHSSVGLMRARRSVDDFFSITRYGMDLTPTQRGFVAHRWLGGLSSDSTCVNGAF
jgi:hypothetical protein